MSVFEAGREYTTRGGHRARIYAVDAGGKHSIHGAIHYATIGEWLHEAWTETGGHHADGEPSSYDLIAPMRPVEVSDAVFNAYHGMVGTSRGPRERLAAGIEAWLQEHPHMLAAWLAGPKP